MGAVSLIGHCGPIWIGATDTERATDPGVKVASVPGAAIQLQPLEKKKNGP